MPDYSISFRKSALKELGRLSPGIQDRVILAVEQLAAAPRPPGCKKLVGSQNAYRLRVGDHRVVYTVDDAIRVVAVEKVRHRREVYR